MSTTNVQPSRLRLLAEHERRNLKMRVLASHIRLRIREEGSAGQDEPKVLRDRLRQARDEVADRTRAPAAFPARSGYDLGSFARLSCNATDDGSSLLICNFYERTIARILSKLPDTRLHRFSSFSRSHPNGTLAAHRVPSLCVLWHITSATTHGACPCSPCHASLRFITALSVATHWITWPTNVRPSDVERPSRRWRSRKVLYAVLAARSMSCEVASLQSPTPPQRSILILASNVIAPRPASPMRNLRGGD
ncbi:hypothetical protein B0J14DRAFT_54712 [Halenospora varia]|nr:hypothetical protein B0J14DRAFT_54712 [Halenospora varia]